MVKTFKCNLCPKIFPSISKLERHKNNKNPCNAIKVSTKCELCSIEFPCLAKLETHNKSKKHINIERQYINDNSINVENQYNIETLNINQNITIVNGFSETNIDIIELEDIKRLLIYEDEIHKIIKGFTDYPDDIYGDSGYLIYMFKFFIKIFAKLNFNLAYSKNHNCMIFSFNKSDSKFIEYQLLEINNTQFNYEKKCIDYKLFIEQFLNLMNRVNNKFQNEDNQEYIETSNVLDFIVKYVNKFTKILFTSGNAKIQIENELLTSYTRFEESKNNLETEEERFRIALLTSRANAFKGLINRIK
jgi:hypothetical protein